MTEYSRLQIILPYYIAIRKQVTFGLKMSPPCDSNGVCLCHSGLGFLSGVVGRVCY
jgi:hypothetical protein